MTDYTLVRSRRRTLSMELKRDGTVVVHAPLRLGVEKIDAFVAAHEAWLARARTRQAERLAAHPEPTEAEREALLARARSELPQRVAHWSCVTGLVPTGVKITGEVDFNGENIYAPSVDVTWLRSRIGMVFQKANPFPMSIYDNIAYGPRTHGVRNRAKLDEIVERSLRSAAIWDEVKDRLKKSALGLSGGQQQRLCIARALAVEPEVLLMDESTSALDPISTSKIEDLACELKDRYTVVMVTHNMQQAARISDNTAFFLLGELVEFGKTEQVFSTPADKRTEDYITGRFG
mgnify:CR=1 FL=1